MRYNMVLPGDRRLARTLCVAAMARRAEHSVVAEVLWALAFVYQVLASYAICLRASDAIPGTDGCVWHYQDLGRPGTIASSESIVLCTGTRYAISGTDAAF
eukprot:1824389-Rhodomonas_salina.1